MKKQTRNKHSPKRFFSFENELFGKIAAVSCAFLVMIIPFMARLFYGQPIVLGSNTAKTLSLLRTADFSATILTDSSQGFSLGTGLFLRLLKFTSLPDNFLVFVPVLFGLVSVLLLLAILKQKYSVRLSFFVVFLLALTPLFLTVFTELVPFGFWLMIFLTALLLGIRGKRGWMWLMLLLLVSENAILGVFAGVVVFMTLEFFSQPKSELLRLKLRKTTVYSFMALVIIGAIAFFISPPAFFEPSLFIASVISDLGGMSGLSIPLMLLVLIGAVRLWSSNKGNIALAIFYVLMISSIAWLPLLAIMLPFFAFFAAVGLDVFTQRSWSFEFMKNFTLLLIGCVLFFSATTFLSIYVNQPPSKDLAVNLANIKDVLPEHAKILARPELGGLIEYYSGHQVVSESYLEHDSLNKWENDKQALLSRNVQRTEQLLNKTGTYYFILDPVLISELQEKSQGVLFLINATDNFETVYASESFNLYMFKNPSIANATSNASISG
jgi:hypothetical protein